ncbi:MAG: molybdopterin-synthase adenylyltransferase MoeB [Pseudomonadota bacterium]
MALTDDELDRYARHIVLREIGGPGQRALQDAKALVIGAGGLGAPAILYLAAAGVGVIGIVDDDAVALSNLQRQVIHTVADIGRPKTQSAAKAVAALNPGVATQLHPVRLDAANADALIAPYDIVLDGSDGFATRRIVNDVCARLRKPLVYAALGTWEGQLTTFRPWEGGPCLQCLFPEDPAPGLAPTCAEAGVLGALAGVMGALQAAEAVKEITGAGEGLSGRLLLWDGLAAEARTVRIRRDPSCPICAQFA